MIEYLRKIKKDCFTQLDFADLISLLETTKLASKCGLGQSAGVAFESFLNNFKKEYRVKKEKEN